MPPWLAALAAGILTLSAQVSGFVDAFPQSVSIVDAVEHLAERFDLATVLPAPLVAMFAYVLRRARNAPAAPTAASPTVSTLLSQNAQAIDIDLGQSEPTRPRPRSEAGHGLLTRLRSTERRLQSVIERVNRLEARDRVPTPVARRLPLNIRQNNPLNIEATAAGRTRWVGEIDSVTRYARFESAERGLRAALYLLVLVYFQRHGLKTVRQIIERWAPRGDNSAAEVDGYVARVAAALMRGEDEVLEIDRDYYELLELVDAMGEVEGGEPLPYTSRQYAQAVLALPSHAIHPALRAAAEAHNA